MKKIMTLFVVASIICLCTMCKNMDKKDDCLVCPNIESFRSLGGAINVATYNNTLSLLYTKSTNAVDHADN